MKTIASILLQAKTQIAATQQTYIDECMNPNISHGTLLILSCLQHFSLAYLNTTLFLPKPLQPLASFKHHAAQIIDETLHNDSQVITTIAHELSSFYELYAHQITAKQKNNEPIALIWKKPWEVYISILAQLDNTLRKDRVLLPALLSAYLLNKELSTLPCPVYIKEQCQLLYQLLLELDMAPFGSKSCEQALFHVKEWLSTTSIVTTPFLRPFIQAITEKVRDFQRKFCSVNIVGQVTFNMRQLDIN